MLSLILLALNAKTASSEWPSKQDRGINVDCTMLPVFLMAGLVNVRSAGTKLMAM